MKLIVCGGRKGDSGYAVRHALDVAHARQPITRIIEGGDLGAGRTARGWAIEHRIDFVTYNLDRETFGTLAGIARNASMLHYGKADAVMAFPGGSLTADMIEQANRAGVTVYEPF